MTQSSSTGYGGVARMFHWLTALLIFVTFGLGWYMSDLDTAEAGTFRLYQIHKSLGITILALAVLRLLWRLTQKAPPWPDHMSSFERLAASGAHWALYALILLQPLTGILQSNAANFPIVFWGGYQLPALIGPSRFLNDVFLNLHHWIGKAIAGVVLLHIAAALRHHIQLKDDVLRNMMPSPAIGVAVFILTAGLVVPPFILMEGGKPTEQAAADPAEDAVQSQSQAADTGAGSETATSGDLWTIEEGSELGFIAQQQGSEVAGKFNTFDAEIQFDPDDLENSRISVDIDVTSIDTGQDSRDQTLNSPSFFDTATWPSAVFASETITATDEGAYEAAGTLTIRDVTEDVVLTFTLDIRPDPADPSRNLAEAKGDLPILRLNYGVGQGDWASTGTVADEVVITIDIQASKPSKQPSG